jgi:hypothetical protein
MLWSPSWRLSLWFEECDQECCRHWKAHQRFPESWLPQHQEQLRQAWLIGSQARWRAVFAGGHFGVSMETALETEVEIVLAVRIQRSAQRKKE